MQVAHDRRRELVDLGLRGPRGRARGPGDSRGHSGRDERFECLDAHGTAGLFPVLDRELRLRAALPVGDLELEVLRADTLLEFEIGAALVVALVRALAAEER